MLGVIQSCCRVEEKRPPVTVRISAYFDDTLNNKFNTGLRESGDSSESGGSYENDYTNVARLEQNAEQRMSGYDVGGVVYVEGIGTEVGDSDSMWGAALGLGDTGVVAKVDRGLNAVIGIVRNLAKDVPITHIHLDCFGFSRGAAAARHFVHKAIRDKETNLKTQLQREGYSVGDVKAKFVGLFDTVASYGRIRSNDTRDLDLDAIKVAESVLHLAAADEYREKFPLTNIASAGSRGKEYFLPGVHSDVGGGYRRVADEKDLCVFSRSFSSSDAAKGRLALEREMEWLVRSGWYHKDEIESEIVLINQQGDANLKIFASKKNISNQYSHIPLHIMAEHAFRAGLQFNAELKRKFAVPSSLLSVDQKIRSHIAAGGSCPEAWTYNSSPELQKVRHDFFHFSAVYGEVLGKDDPRWVDSGQNAQRREREIHAG
jgi:hypothetical protein